MEHEKLDIIDNKEFILKNKIQDLMDLLNKYLSGEKIELFSRINRLGIDLNIQEIFPTTFSQNVVKYLLNLELGETTTYSQIGDNIGSKAYRAIGNVCKSNPLPLIVPCHRVLRKNGEIGGFMGKSGNTWQTNLKKKLLNIEGYRGKNSILLQSKLI
ncbi:MAG: methylated-DNA--[protein]-cysteine S-methyltransferase [Candidatus Hermodarchaeota archaeon]